ncbi:hypothetical protein D3C86_1953290 [compost metagenome]
MAIGGGVATVGLEDVDGKEVDPICIAIHMGKVVDGFGNAAPDTRLRIMGSVPNTDRTVAPVSRVRMACGKKCTTYNCPTRQ